MRFSVSIIIVLPSRLPGTGRARPALDQEQIQENVDASDLECLKRGVPVHWRKAFLESGLFIALMNGKRAGLEPWTQARMKGPLFKDYWRSIKGSLKWKWKDGDDFFINYIRHPAEGATFAFIMRQNDPNSIDPASCGFSKKYFKQTLKTVIFSAIGSTLFEIGPVSEASIGNVGYFKESGLVDFFVTPTVGVGFMIGQDLLDNYGIKKLERKIHNKIFSATLRVVLNPSRSLGNAVAFKKPWYRKRDKLQRQCLRLPGSAFRTLDSPSPQQVKSDQTNTWSGVNVPLTHGEF
jgi:hypothetical protein